MMRSTRVHIERVQALARRDEQAVPLWTAKAQVARCFRQFDQSDAASFGVENMHAVITIAHPAGARPKVALNVTADAIGSTCADVSGQ